MKYLCNAGRYIKALLFTGAALLLINSCAISDIAGIAGGGGTVTPPKWDLDFEIPLISKTESMGDYFTIPDIAPITINNVDMSLLPDPSTVDLLVAGSLSTGSLAIDFNGDSVNDFDVDRLVSDSGDGYIELKIFTTDSSALPVGALTVSNCVIDGTTYTFDGGTAAGSDTVILRSTNFLSSPGASHNLDPGSTESPNKFDFDSFELTKNGAITTVSFEFSIKLGTTYSIVGTTAATETKLYSLADQSVPLSQDQMLIKSFYINLNTTSGIPVTLKVNAKFTSEGTDYPLTDNGSSDIAISQGSGSSDLETDDTVFTKPNLTVSFDLFIPANAVVTFSNSMDVGIELLVGGKGVIDLNSTMQ